MFHGCRVLQWILLVLPLAPGGTEGQALQGTGPVLHYPSARRDDVADTVHGVIVPDPYRWMEDMTSAETEAWVSAQDTLTRTYLHAAPAYAAVRTHLAGLRVRNAIRLPQQAGGRTFFYGTPERGPRQSALPTNLYVQERAEVSAHPLIREADFPFRLFLDYRVSPDGKYVAVGTRAAPGSSWMTWRVLDVDRRTFLPDRIDGAFLLEDLSWAADGRGFFYGRFDAPMGTADRASLRTGHRVAYHRVGTDQSLDSSVLTVSRDAGDRDLSITAMPDGRAVLIVGRRSNGLATAIWRGDQSDPTGRATVLVPDTTGAFRALGTRGGEFLFYTTVDAPRGRIVAIDPVHPGRSWATVVPERQEAIVPGGQGQAAPLQIGNRLIIPYQQDLVTRLRIFDLRGRRQYVIRVPDGGMLFNSGGGNPLSGSRDGQSLFYQFIGITDPISIERLDLATGARSTWFRPSLPFDPDVYETRLVSYPSADGTPVPMSITLKKGTPLDGSAPLMLYAYGADGFVMRPFYRPMFMAWLEMGGMFAIANVRGGGARGEGWHEAAIGATKGRSIDDFVSAAEWLIQQGYTRPSRLVVNGVSAGGVLPAALLVRHPSLAAAALVDYPLLDMVRYERFAGGGFRDFGSPSDSTVFRALLGYSPYANIRPGICYAPVLVSTSEADDQAPPLHAYKFVAALQAAQSCSNPALLNMVWGSGHSAYGSAKHSLFETMTDQLTFLLRTLHLTPEFASGGER